ncbi:MAG: chromate resistance protein [Planctomycetes bacterium]|nr:chromate resistance protein [Planctomycetota bacterium]
MKWVTREKVKVDRVACPWLIKKFIDPTAEFLFVPADKVAETADKTGAIPYDVPNVELGHKEGKCSFEAFITKYKLEDSALLLLSKIVHGADVQQDLYKMPEAAGLKAIAQGFSYLGMSDHDILKHEFIVYDALYAYCKQKSLKT